MPALRSVLVGLVSFEILANPRNCGIELGEQV